MNNEEETELNKTQQQNYKSQHRDSVYTSSDDTKDKTTPEESVDLIRCCIPARSYADKDNTKYKTVVISLSLKSIGLFQDENTNPKYSTMPDLH